MFDRPCAAHTMGRAFGGSWLWFLLRHLPLFLFESLHGPTVQPISYRSVWVMGPTVKPWDDSRRETRAAHTNIRTGLPLPVLNRLQKQP